MIRTLIACTGALAAAPALATAPAAAPAHAHAQRPSFSPDGTRLSFEANDHDAKRITLFVGDPTAGTYAPVRPPSPAASGLTAGFSTASTDARVVAELTWSPTTLGRFAYAAATDGVDFDLYLDQGGVIVQDPAPEGGPAWSPDGRYVAFTSGRTGEGDLYVLDLTALATPPRQLTALSGSSEVFATWTPDSAGLAYVAHGASGDNLWLLPTLNTSPVALTRWAGVQTRPRFSPDGTWVAFYANHEDDARFDLYALRPQHLAEPVLLLPDVVPNEAGPVWTPDGRYVLSVANDDARFDPIIAVRPDAPFEATTLALNTVGNRDFDVGVGPAGPQIAWTALGTPDDDVRDFRKLYVAPLPALP